MRHNTLKLMALTSAVALSFAFTNNSFAQTQVPVTLTTNSAITAAPGDDMDFGSWILVHDGTGTGNVTLVLSPLGGVTETVGNTSVGEEITASASAGSVDFSTPAAAAINVYAAINPDFSDAGLALSALTYSLNGGSVATLSVASATPTAMTSTGGGTTDVLSLGGTVTMTATPADADHTASLDIFISY